MLVAIDTPTTDFYTQSVKTDECISHVRQNIPIKNQHYWWNLRRSRIPDGRRNKKGKGLVKTRRIRRAYSKLQSERTTLCYSVGREKKSETVKTEPQQISKSWLESYFNYSLSLSVWVYEIFFMFSLLEGINILSFSLNNVYLAILFWCVIDRNL